MKNDVNHIVLTGKVLKIWFPGDEGYGHIDIEYVYDNSKSVIRILFKENKDFMKDIKLQDHLVLECHYDCNFLIIDRYAIMTEKESA